MDVHNLYVCMQLLSATDPDRTSLLFRGLLSDTLGMVKYPQAKEFTPQEYNTVQHCIGFCTQARS